MNAIQIAQDAVTLPALVERAASALANAKTAAEVLAARDRASVAYDVAKRAARLASIKNAHDDLIAAVYRAQADALVIEAQAKRRLADEYDAAQQRGEIASGRDGPGAGVLNGNAKATAADIGLSRKEVHEARELRDAEVTDPGVVRRTVDDAIAAGEEPTKAKVRRAVQKIAPRGEAKMKVQAKKAAPSQPIETQRRYYPLSDAEIHLICLLRCYVRDPGDFTLTIGMEESEWQVDWQDGETQHGGEGASFDEAWDAMDDEVWGR